MRRWVGFDSSIRSFGYAVMRESGSSTVAPVLEAIGTITTMIDPGAPKMLDRARRIADLAKNIGTVLTSARPDVVFIESLALGMRTGMGTVQTLGRVRGLVEGICFERKIPLFEIRPEIIKQAVTGDKGASKSDVARVLARRFYPTPIVFSANEDETDAIAVAHVGWSKGRSGPTIQNGVVRNRVEEDDLDF